MLELTVRLVDDGWTVAADDASPIAASVRRGAEAMQGEFRSIGERAEYESGSSVAEPCDTKDRLRPFLRGLEWSSAREYVGLS